MSVLTVNADKLNEAIQGVLEEYNDEIVGDLKKITRRAMRTLVQETKATAPVSKRKDGKPSEKETKHYKEAIASTKIDDNVWGVAWLWYVKSPHYRLTHLLNNGHALVDGGWWDGSNFVGEATDRIVETYYQEVKEAVKRG